jgi:hypothetical protein
LHGQVFGSVGGALVDQDMQEIREACLVELAGSLEWQFAGLGRSLLRDVALGFGDVADQPVSTFWKARNTVCW